MIVVAKSERDPRWQFRKWGKWRRVKKAGPPDEPRDSHGEWTSGGAVLQADKYNTRIVSKPSSRSVRRGRRTIQEMVMAHAVEYQDSGRPMRTSWTTSRGEAEAWQAAIQQTGYSASGRGYPTE
jgi:hypothetical protein